MTQRDFCYWLQGFFEMADPKTLDAKQTEMIKRHLQLCFTNVTGGYQSNEDSWRSSVGSGSSGIGWGTCGTIGRSMTMEEEIAYRKKQAENDGKSGTWC